MSGGLSIPDPASILKGGSWATVVMITALGRRKKDCLLHAQTPNGKGEVSILDTLRKIERGEKKRGALSLTILDQLRERSC